LDKDTLTKGTLMKLRFILIVFGSLVITNAYAQETYNIQAGLQYGKLSNDDKLSQTSMIVNGAYYLKPINIDQSQPFMEIDFLQKANNFSVQYGFIKNEDSTFASTTVNPLGISGTFYVDNFAFGASTSSWGSTNFTLKSNTLSYVGIKSTTNDFNIGYFVTPTTLISYINSKDNTIYTPSTELAAIKDSKKTKNSINSHTVMSFGGPGFLVVDLSYGQIKSTQTKSETNKEYSAKFRYYPEAKSFFEGGYTSNSGDKAGDKGKTQLFGVGYSFTPRFAVMLSNEHFSGDVSAEKSSNTSTILTAGYRF
jgi:hypothetical protein